MEVVVQNHKLNFIQMPLIFHGHDITNLFAKKNNKTLAETLENHRYAGLSSDVYRCYFNSLNAKLGVFLMDLKSNGDDFYLRFLNKHGDKVYCDFSIASTSLSKQKGIYIFTLGKEIKYVGRSHDPFEKRINQGYGRISPKNCYIDGQSTNCHKNSLIAQYYKEVAFHVFPVSDDFAIDQLEKYLITAYKPKWNIVL